MINVVVVVFVLILGFAMKEKAMLGLLLLLLWNWDLGEVLWFSKVGFWLLGENKGEGNWERKQSLFWKTNFMNLDFSRNV